MLFTIGGESKGLIFHSQVLAQRKRTAPPPISKKCSLSNMD
jgi:hypothetical protein